MVSFTNSENADKYNWLKTCLLPLHDDMNQQFSPR